MPPDLPTRFPRPSLPHQIGMNRPQCFLYEMLLERKEKPVKIAWTYHDSLTTEQPSGLSIYQDPVYLVRQQESNMDQEMKYIT